MSLDSDAEVRPPVELLADIHELLELFGAIIDPIVERIAPVVQENLGEIELAVVSVELHIVAALKSQIEALPGNAAHN